MASLLTTLFVETTPDALRVFWHDGDYFILCATFQTNDEVDQYTKIEGFETVVWLDQMETDILSGEDFSFSVLMDTR